ncbi:ATP-binding cassette, subfamily B/ATP-binding cassette, subfamily B, MsbA [Anaerovirgula multivorans]|uniref:ATP-binding cassette, subfamily B/ATP-binding cassette, subfamily B, MsbA n=1 Tax=Anaerovirgula multivorans TaxID=312168 RepID=A0A239HYR8_9FIRM|nr:ABC transporter ATP-binding protein [Anaerovirgula multivorans]SNS86500.1 ATP-binding cassette, subfamily B/ATP-binding cassette, subfamily B, MsbA [Anaerovirgula multivorans]
MKGFHKFNEETVGKAYDSKLMKRLLHYAKPYWLLLAISILLLTLIAGIDIARPYIIKIAIDDYMNVYDGLKEFRAQDYHALRRLSILYLILITLGILINYIQVYLLNYTSNKIVFKIRQQLFEHLQKMSLSFFDKNPVGRLITRVTNDTETLHEMYTGVLVNLFKDIFLLTGIIVIMVKMNIQLTLIALSVVPIILLSAAFFRSKVRAAYRSVREKLGVINALLNANITGMKTIHTFSREEQQLQEFDESNQALLNSHQKQNFLYAIFRPSMEIIRSLGIAMVLWYGGGQVIKGRIEFGVLFAFINYIKQFFQPINDLTEKYNILQSAMASSERIFSLLDEEAAIEDNKDPIKNHNFQGEIEFKNVWFAYQEEDWVLKNINFKILPGESIAFVGATGAGKSSIIHLMGRFYDVQKGEILVDGINIKNIPLKDLRQNIGILLQDVFMFTGTIKDNIVLNNQSFSQEDVEKVAKYVNAHQFIKKMKMQYDEPLVEKGSNLSTGQRQLLSFARALIYDPSVFVFDEATSNIDTETEGLIQDTIEKIIKDKTTIAIAHRLSTIQNCDKIIVLHKGEIRESGNHQQLLQQQGLYYHLYQLQYKENSHFA